ncbi:MAG TPA: hypothetical protein DEQ38_04715 [Elusimicrobia bacterium]|nr:MAG: hypothetical protein A2089_00680 [Elusimicrobia bacterium GWD2_63_28]HCC47404.1 hypothetical protein [Elusimicrobiota bacterium]
MAKLDNILESVEFLAEGDLLVAELDRRLSFTALAIDKATSMCSGKAYCDCLIHKTCTCINVTTPAASAVRG